MRESRTYEASVENLSPAMDFFSDGLTEAGVSLKSIMQLQIAFEELFVNVANYAYPDKNGKVTVSFDFSDNTAEIEISDAGIPFNPLAKPDPDLAETLEKREPGGLGVFMAKELTDEQFYVREDGMNKITIRKRMG